MEVSELWTEARSLSWSSSALSSLQRLLSLSRETSPARHCSLSCWGQGEEGGTLGSGGRDFREWGERLS